MADISKCEGGECPLKGTCYRFTAPMSEYQSMFVDIPLKQDGTCDEYWQVEDFTNKYTLIRERDNLTVEGYKIFSVAFKKNKTYKKHTDNKVLKNCSIVIRHENGTYWQTTLVKEILYSTKNKETKTIKFLTENSVYTLIEKII